MRNKTMVLVGGALLMAMNGALAFDAGVHYNETRSSYNQGYKTYAKALERHADKVLHSARRAENRRDAALKHAWKAYRAEQKLARRVTNARNMGHSFYEYAPQAYESVDAHVATEYLK